jgi:hypothetical protein
VKEVEPPELARLLDFAERPRQADWSLRAALCRYAQGDPQRVSDILTGVRRIEFALQGPLTKQVEQEGPALWAALTSGAEDDELLLGLLRSMADLDQLGDLLAAWSVDRAGGRLDTAIDDIVARVIQRLDDLGVAREDRASGDRPRPGRSRPQGG